MTKVFGEDHLHRRKDDPPPTEISVLASQAAGLRSVAEDLLKTIRWHRIALWVGGIGLVSDLLLSFFIFGNVTAICDERNFEAQRQRELWGPVVASSPPSPQRDEFQKRLDTAYGSIDCSVAASIKRTIIR